MIVLFERSFFKSLDKLDDNLLKARIKTLIDSMEKADAIVELTQIKAMKGYTGFYRIRLGDYRVGFEITENNEISLLLVAHH